MSSITLKIITDYNQIKNVKKSCIIIINTERSVEDLEDVVLSALFPNDPKFYRVEEWFNNSTRSKIVFEGAEKISDLGIQNSSALMVSIVRGRESRKCVPNTTEGVRLCLAADKRDKAEEKKAQKQAAQIVANGNASKKLKAAGMPGDGIRLGDGEVIRASKKKRSVQKSHPEAADDATDLEDAVAYYERVAKQNELGSVGIKTGLPGFDNYLPAGIMPGQLGVFLAYPGIGKSWMALYFAVQAWKQGKSPMIISLEMSETEVRNRVFAIMGEGLWSHRKLSNGEIEIDMLRKWHANKVEGRPEFHIISNDSGGEVTPSVIRGKIDQYKPDFVIVDYLQLMSPNQKSDNETVRMKNLSRELKLMAISEEVLHSYRFII